MTPNPTEFSRRRFVQTTAALGIATQGAIGGAQGDDQEVNGGGLTVPSVVLGRTGIEVSALGIGCAYFQRAHVDSDDVQETLKRALELGVNYLDVAPNYGNEEIGFSEEKMGPSLADRAFRDRFFLVSKTEEETRDGTWRLLEQSLKRLQTDRIDLIHLHNLGHEPRWTDLPKAFGPHGAMEALREARAQGIIRFIGASGHLHPSRFHYAIDSDEIDVLMNAVNFVVQHSYDFENKIWARARLKNLGLVAMKVLGGGGSNSQSPGKGGFRIPQDRYELAIRYAISIPGIHVAVIGMEGIPELEQAAQTLTKVSPLTEEEQITIAREGLELLRKDQWRQAYGTPIS